MQAEVTKCWALEESIGLEEESVLAGWGVAEVCDWAVVDWAVVDWAVVVSPVDVDWEVVVDCEVVDSEVVVVVGAVPFWHRGPQDSGVQMQAGSISSESSNENGQLHPCAPKQPVEHVG